MHAPLAPSQLSAFESRLLDLGDGLRPDKYHVDVRDRGEAKPLRLNLFRYRGSGPPVMLIHGASAWSGSFAVPRGRSMVERLRAHSADPDVWLLDWRGGRNVVNRYVGSAWRERFTWDRVAEGDVVEGLKAVQALRHDDRRIAVLGHCVGGGTLAMAISAMPQGARYLPSRVVLSTLGLFHVQPWDGLLRASDFVLERVRAQAPGATYIHPNATAHPWPDPLDEAWRIWPKHTLPPPTITGATFQRLAFMFGRICIWDRLPAALQHDAAMLEQFGAMHLTAFLQAGQFVRRGFAAPYDSPERIARGQTAALDERYLQRERWGELEAITILTGHENDLWHRDAIDRMGEWLAQAVGPNDFAKHVLRAWGHQDLLWGIPKPDEADPIDLYLTGLLGSAS